MLTPTPSWKDLLREQQQYGAIEAQMQGQMPPQEYPTAESRLSVQLFAGCGRWCFACCGNTHTHMHVCVVYIYTHANMCVHNMYVDVYIYI